MSSFQAKKDAKSKSAAVKKVISVGAVADKSPKLLVAQSAIPDDERLWILPPSRFYVDEQVRRYIDPAEIQERAASMKGQGQIQPIVVYPADADGRHKIDKGECRWRAAQLLDGFKLKAIIDPEAPNRDKAHRIIGQITENDQRSDLVAIDKAAAIKDLVGTGMSLEKIATELGWISGSGKPNITKVGRHLSILKLPEEGQQLVTDGVLTDLITLEHLRKIYDINPSKFSVLCDLAKGDGLTRKRAEQEYKQCKVNIAVKDDSAGQVGSLEPGEDNEAASNELDVSLNPRRIETGAAAVKPNSNAKQTDAKLVQSKGLAAKTACVHVEIEGRGTGIIWFGDSPEEEGYAWVDLDSGKREHFSVADLRITKVIC